MAFILVFAAASQGRLQADPPLALTGVNFYSEDVPLINLAAFWGEYELHPGDYSFFWDPGGKLGPAEAADRLLGKPSMPDIFQGRYGYLRGGLWFAFRIRIPGGQSHLAVLEKYGVDSFKVFLQPAGSFQHWVGKESGWAMNASSRSLPMRHSNVVFKVQDLSPPGAQWGTGSEEFDCLVRLESRTSLSLSLSIGEPGLFLIREQPMLIFFGALTLLFGISLFVSLGLWAFFKESLFALVSLYILVSSLIILYSYGFANWLVWPDLPAMGRLILTWGWAVTAMLQVRFILVYFDFKRRLYRVFLAGSAYMVFWGFMSLALLVVEARGAQMISIAMGMTLPFAQIGLILAGLKTKARRVWWFLGFWVFFAGGVVILYLRNLGLIAETAWIETMVLITIYSQWVCLAIPLCLDHILPLREGCAEAEAPPDEKAPQLFKQD